MRGVLAFGAGQVAPADMKLKHDLYLSHKPLAGFIPTGLMWPVYFAQMPVIKATVGASDVVHCVAPLVTGLGVLVPILAKRTALRS